MDWIKVTITTTADGIDPISGRLLDLGINGIEISDKDDFKEFLEANRKYWDYVDKELERLKEADTTITLYLSDGAAGLEQLTAIDMTSLSEVSAVYAGRVKITFGTMNDIEYKCSWAARLLLGEDDSAMIGEHETGTLDVSHRTQDGKGQAIWRAGAI